MAAPPLVLVDTCVLVNLLATGQARDILSMSGYSFAICSAVQGEAIFLRPTDPQAQPERVRLEPLIEPGILSVLHLDTEEEKTLFVDYASQLDDGEAMSIALAVSRGSLLATDDQKARRLFIEATRDATRLLFTSQILKMWATNNSIGKDRLNAVLSQVTLRAKFYPSKNDPEYQWWCNVTR